MKVGNLIRMKTGPSDIGIIVEYLNTEIQVEISDLEYNWVPIEAIVIWWFKDQWEDVWHADSWHELEVIS